MLRLEPQHLIGGAKNTIQPRAHASLCDLGGLTHYVFISTSGNDNIHPQIKGVSGSLKVTYSKYKEWLLSIPQSRLASRTMCRFSGLTSKIYFSLVFQVRSSPSSVTGNGDSFHVLWELQLQAAASKTDSEADQRAGLQNKAFLTASCLLLAPAGHVTHTGSGNPLAESPVPSSNSALWQRRADTW